MYVCHSCLFGTLVLVYETQKKMNAIKVFFTGKGGPKYHIFSVYDVEDDKLTKNGVCFHIFKPKDTQPVAATNKDTIIVLYRAGDLNNQAFLSGMRALPEQAVCFRLYLTVFETEAIPAEKDMVALYPEAKDVIEKLHRMEDQNEFNILEHSMEDLYTHYKETAPLGSVASSSSHPSSVKSKTPSFASAVIAQRKSTMSDTPEVFEDVGSRPSWDKASNVFSLPPLAGSEHTVFEDAEDVVMGSIHSSVKSAVPSELAGSFASAANEARSLVTVKSNPSYATAPAGSLVDSVYKSIQQPSTASSSDFRSVRSRASAVSSSIHPPSGPPPSDAEHGPESTYSNTTPPPPTESMLEEDIL